MFDGPSLEQWQRNALAVADAIEQERYGFNMHTWLASHWGTHCGTIACIGGTCDLIFNYGEKRPWYEGAQIDLGLTDLQADSLFFCETPDSPCIRRVTRQQAVNVLRHYAMTGEVDWSKRDTPVAGQGEG